MPRSSVKAVKFTATTHGGPKFDLQTALEKLGLEVERPGHRKPAPFARTNRRNGAARTNGSRAARADAAPGGEEHGAAPLATTSAIREFQKRAGLTPTGKLTVKTKQEIQSALTHEFFAGNKKRTGKIHAMLERVGHPVKPEEVKRREFGKSTERAIKAFAKDAGIELDKGRVTDELVAKLEADALAARFSTKTQVSNLHRILRKVSRIAKLETEIHPVEVKRREVGESTKETIRAFQTKYKLPVTGELDPVTYDRIVSVARSRPKPPALLTVKSADDIAPVNRTLRLNMRSKQVGELQKSLAFFGHKIDEKEHKSREFGATTRNAVLELQRANSLPQTGHFDTATRKVVNAAIADVIPPARVTDEAVFHLRGSVRDELWRGKPNMKVQVWTQGLRGQATMLAERKTQATGFYDIPYSPPRNPVDGKVLDPFEVEVRVVDGSNRVVSTRTEFNPTPIAWANFTDGDRPYRGPSFYETTAAAIQKVAVGINISELKETDTQKDLTMIAKHAAIDVEDVMRVVLSHLVSIKFGDGRLTPEAVFAFIGQNLPPSLPSDLLSSTVQWTLIDALIEQTMLGIAFMEPDVQADTIEHAADGNVIPIATVAAEDDILKALKDRRTTFALQKPILVGNGTMQSMLAATSIPAASYPKVAEAFLAERGLGDSFWQRLRSNASQFGGAPAIDDFEKTVELGTISKHHVPTFKFLKQEIASSSNIDLKQVSDTAKLSRPQWISLIKKNGSKVPDGLTGTGDQKVAAYALTLEQQSERLFPSIALAARTADRGVATLENLDGVIAVLDKNPDLDLGETSVQQFVKQTGASVADEVAAEMSVIQRVQRISTDAETGSALIDDGIHHSMQIVSIGKERLVKQLEGKNIDRARALTTFGQAELQYAQVLGLLAEFRGELKVADPEVITPKSAPAPGELAGDVPNLEALFGSMDFCACAHCQTVYSPAAYLADVLRFLDEHPSQTANKMVRQVLFDRRPDLGNLKLNCENTETPLPYVDLVCEVLEAAVPAPGTTPNFSFQTTRPPEELRAFPENLRKEAYDVLRGADFPMGSVFDLWQQEARVWLDHLGVPRWELMELMQSRPSSGAPAPPDAAIGGEYFGLSTKETSLITTVADNATRQSAIWGFDCSVSKVGVLDFLEHGEITYDELEQLVQIRWVNGGNTGLKIERPSVGCALSEQKVAGCTLARFDRAHRFLRLWRNSGWEMWELDLLIRAPRIGAGNLDGAAVARLHKAKQVAKRLNLSADELSAFFGELNTRERIQPGETTKKIDPFYVTLFQNRAVTDPVDPGLALPLAAGTMTDHKIAIAAGLGITEADFERLTSRPGAAALNQANLARMYATVKLAGELSMSIEQLLVLVDLVPGDVLASPQATLELLETRDHIAASGLELDELDFLLNHRPDSHLGLRDEALTELLAKLRDSRRAAGTTADEQKNAIVAEVATAFSVTPEQSRVLVTKLKLGATTLIDALAVPALTKRKTLPDGTETYETELSEANFADAYRAYRLLHKVSLLVNRQKLASVDDLEWLLDKHATFKLLDLSSLPITAAPAQSLFPKWLNTAKLLGFHQRYPEPEGVTLRKVLDDAAARVGLGDLHQSLAKLTQWPQADIAALDATLKLSYTSTVNDYVAVDTLLRLEVGVKAVRRLGVSAAAAAEWTDRETDGKQSTIAQQTRNAAKAKYDTSTWLSKAAPLYDVIREQKRDALVDYLVERSRRETSPTITVAGKTYANPAYWRDSDDMLRYFLIDVEMTPCQLTSRLKQAMSSTQMFVQRCFLNLEQPFVQVAEDDKEDTVSLNSWRQWKYMKNYRVWEAARKVFLYPENWILPELRDDKTPFFKELEDELQQAELTDEHAEGAVRHYLEKVHEVSRLTVLAAHHEIDDENPYDNLPPTINKLHVVARTKADPAIYYYRQYDLNYGVWSAWEKIDLDISGDHLLPVVYNRKLHLFWLQFMEKPQKVKQQPPAQASNSTDAPDPPKQLEIQLAWSVRTDDGWTSRKLSREKLVHPWERPLDSYHLKTRYKPRENHLWVDVYISTSPDFNNKKFWDPYTNSRDFAAAFRHDETGRPWHSSSFVFDGNVVATKLKPLSGYYHLADPTGMASHIKTYTTSYDFVTRGYETQRSLSPLAGGYEIGPRLPLPEGMHYRFNRMANNVQKPNPSRLNVLELSATRTILQGAKAPFEIVFSQDRIYFDTGLWGAEPFLYQDPQRSFFVKSNWQTVQLGYNQVVQQLKYDLYPFYQPYSDLFLRELDRRGPDGLLNRRIQRFPHTFFPGNTFDFSNSYAPVAPNAADATAENDVIDFSLGGAYSTYNWETFFHIPLMIATKLSQNQRFEEAMKWFHYIFDPTNVEALPSPQRFWVTKPFYDTTSDEYRKERIENLLRDIGANLDQLRAWKNDPFNPHKIARYRPVAYQRNVVMKYIDNLIAWADQLFSQDTIETINQATLLYVLAHELLGRRPVKVPSPERADKSYNELTVDGDLDPFGNKSIIAKIENFAPAPPGATNSTNGAEPLPLINPMYFRIPPNDDLLKYWDTVEDRLFKIRHCMNIRGIVRQLPLFEPPIDPALLVKASAAGVDIGSLFTAGAVEPGQYRYRSLIAKANEFCSEVKALGDKMLSALEKRDAEGLALLRSTHEVKVLEANKEVRKSQITEAENTVLGLEQSKAAAETKRDYYSSREFINAWEGTALGLQGASALAQVAIAVGHITAGGLKLIPDFVAGASGFGGSPHVTAEVAGGDKIGEVAKGAVETLSAIATGLDKVAGLATTVGSYTRRQEEWDQQLALAKIEIDQIDKQIVAAQVRQAIAEKELENVELQIENAKAADDYMRGKYTNQQLYDWTITQISTVYFQAYKLAYDMANRAQAALQFELGRPDMSFIEFGYWDSLKKGLMSAEKLSTDLRRMEGAYLENNVRELEMTKHVSLAEFFPLSLMALKTGGACTVQVPEWLYDMDFPGHYRRRIKSVSLTLPCVTGPYTGVHATVSLTRNGLRVDDSPGAAYGDPLSANNDTRFASNRVPVDMIATSHGQNDNGLFELSFNDERFLPFEGAGAVSEWRIELPGENAFDRATLTDAILHIRYSATPGQSGLVTAARSNLAAVLPTSGMQLFAVKNEFGDDWYRLFHPDADAAQSLVLSLRAEHFPFFTRNKTVKVSKFELFIDAPGTANFEVRLAQPGQEPTGPAASADRDGAFGNVPHFSKSFSNPKPAAVGDWTLQIRKVTAGDWNSLAKTDLRNAYVVVNYAL
jgi:peptidoglycan hydrolase-like protein with peptidoglycan-binding domain